MMMHTLFWLAGFMVGFGVRGLLSEYLRAMAAVKQAEEDAQR